MIATEENQLNTPEDRMVMFNWMIDSIYRVQADRIHPMYFQAVSVHQISLTILAYGSRTLPKLRHIVDELETTLLRCLLQLFFLSPQSKQFKSRNKDQKKQIRKYSTKSIYNLVIVRNFTFRANNPLSNYIEEKELEVYKEQQFLI